MSLENKADDFFCFRLRKHARKVTNFFDMKLKKLGLRSTQVSLLLALSDGDKTITRASEALGMDRSTLTRGIGPLERDGLVKRLGSVDVRQKVYTLTESGKEAARKGSVLLEEAQHMIFADNAEYKRIEEVL